MIRRINLYAGPGAGKSVLASWLYAELNISNYKAQYNGEYVKQWCFDGRRPHTWDQIYFLAKQLYSEHKQLASGQVDVIINDSPVLMVGAYAIRNGMDFADELISLSQKFDKTYPALHLFLDRADIPYKHEGRFETYEQAIATDEIIEETMKKHLPSYTKAKTKDRSAILDMIIKNLKNPSS